MSDLILRTFTLIVSIDEDGREALDWRWDGDAPTGMAGVGYLEAAKLGMYHEALHDGMGGEGE